MAKNDKTMKGMWKNYQKQKLFIKLWRWRKFIIWDICNCFWSYFYMQDR